MLNDVRRDCVTYASRLGNYQAIDLTTLMNKYCEALDSNDRNNQNYYLSAIILRMWYVIDKLYQKSAHLGILREDMFDWLVEGINYACKYRAWQNPAKHTNAQACLNQCINTIRLQHYYEYNLDKNRANYNTISLEATYQEDDEKSNTLLDTMADEGENEKFHQMEGTDMAINYIQNFINQNKVVEAIILDNIAFNDVERRTKKTVKKVDEVTGETKKAVENYTEFWAYKLVKILSDLPEDYAHYFNLKYKIKPEILDVALAKVRSSNNQKLYRYLRKCLADARQQAGGN